MRTALLTFILDPAGTQTVLVEGLFVGPIKKGTPPPIALTDHAR
jgi:hypothetical protein